MKVEVENEIIKPLLAEEGKPVNDMSSTDFYINSFFEVFWKHCRICSKVNSVQPPTQQVYIRLLEKNYFSGKTANRSRQNTTTLFSVPLHLLEQSERPAESTPLAAYDF